MGRGGREGGREGRKEGGGKQGEGGSKTKGNKERVRKMRGIQYGRSGENTVEEEYGEGWTAY